MLNYFKVEQFYININWKFFLTKRHCLLYFSPMSLPVAIGFHLHFIEKGMKNPEQKDGGIFNF